MNGIKPNKANKARFEALTELGCIVCLLHQNIKTPPQIHHMAGSRTQDGHSKTLPLCYFHHMADLQLPSTDFYISRHPNKKQFENAYGSEYELLTRVDALIK